MAVIISHKATKRKRVDDIVFYQLDGQLIARTIGSISKRRLATAPQYKTLRDNQSEFGLSSRLTGTLRRALKPYLPFCKVAYTNGILTGAFRKIIQQGNGEPGKRTFDSNYLKNLQGLGLNAERAILCSGKPLRLDHNKAEVYLRITYGKLRKLFGSNALPLQVVVGLIAVSEIEFTHGRYEVLQQEWHGKTVYNSKKILEAWPSQGELRLKAKFDGKIPNRVGLIGVLGVIPL